jgi:hypothetical protein
MRRREFITLVGGAALARPLVARAQQPAMPIVGFLRSTSLAPYQSLVVAFGQGLKEADFVEGQNVAIEYRYADNQIDRLPVLVADLIRLPVAVIVVNSGAAFAAKAATNDGTDRRRWRRSGQERPRRQSKPPGRQPYGCDLAWRFDRNEAAGTPAPGRAQGNYNCNARATGRV